MNIIQILGQNGGLTELQQLEQCKKFEMLFKHIETIKISKYTKYDNTCKTLLLLNIKQTYNRQHIHIK